MTPEKAAYEAALKNPETFEKIRLAKREFRKTFDDLQGCGFDAPILGNGATQFVRDIIVASIIGAIASPDYKGKSLDQVLDSFIQPFRKDIRETVEMVLKDRLKDKGEKE